MSKRKSELPKDILKISQVTSAILLFLKQLGMANAIPDMDIFRDYLWSQYTNHQKGLIEQASEEGEMLCTTCGTEASWGGCDYKLCPEYRLLKARD